MHGVTQSDWYIVNNIDSFLALSDLLLYYTYSVVNEDESQFFSLQGSHALLSETQINIIEPILPLGFIKHFFMLNSTEYETYTAYRHQSRRNE